MAQKSTDTAAGAASGSSAATLARGKACLRCRKRKMRCDGAKPACVQCVRAHKPDACQYDDGKGKTRTQALREKIARLEEEIAHLRDPENPSAPSIVLRNPHGSPSSSPNSGGVVGQNNQSFSSSGSTPSSSPMGSPFSSFDSLGSPQPGFPPTRTVSPAMSMPFDDVDPEILNGLLEIVILHRDQCGLALHVQRLRTSMTDSPTGAKYFSSYHVQPSRHPVLANAIYLWASFLSRPGPLCSNEHQFLSKTQSALADALNNSQHPHQLLIASPQLLHQSITGGSPSPSSHAHSPQPTPTSTTTPAPVLIDTIQALVLLARYFFAIGRLHAAGYYSNAAGSLAVQSGLHQINSSLAYAVSQQVVSPLAGLSAMYSSSLRLPPARDGIELGERICVFWQVFVLDRLLSVTLRRPPTVVDDDSVESRIDTPWPDDIEEYEHISVDTVQGDRTLQNFFSQQAQVPVTPGGFTSLALRAKAAALYSAATHVSMNWGLRGVDTSSGSSSATTNPAQNFNYLEATIIQFASTLLPSHQLGAGLPDKDRRTHIVVHTLAHAAYIQLHLRFAREGNVESFEKCIRSARGAALLIRHLNDMDYEFLDPVFAASWAVIAAPFALEKALSLNAWQASSQAKGHRNELDLVVFAMTKISTKFPIIGTLQS